MNILQVIESSSGGSGRYTIELSCALIKRGCQVHLAYAEPRLDKRFVRGIEEIKALGGTAEPVPIQLPIGFHDVQAVRALRQIIKREGPFDILHLQSSKAGAVGRLARIGMHQPTVYTPHLLRTASPGLGKRSAMAYGAIERFLAKWADRLVLVSEFEYDHAVSQGLPKKKLVLIENCSDPAPMGDRSKLREELGYSDSHFVLGYVGRLAPQKDPMTLMRSLASFKGSDRLRAVIIGDGPLEAECQAFVKDQGLESQVRFLGPAEGPFWMPAFDAFVLSSASESWPNVVLEAAHASLPIIATRVGSVPKFVIEGESGLVISPESPEEMTKAVQTLLDQPELGAKMGRAALERSKSYSVASMTDRMIQLYEEILAEQGRTKTAVPAQ